MPILSGFLVASLLTTGYAMSLSQSTLQDETLYGILPVINQKVTYFDVVDCGSVSQADLFRRARLWVAQGTTSANPPFLVNDKETGDLVSRGRVVVNLPRSDNFTGGIFAFRYSLVIECANRKYRATITQFDLEDSVGERLTPIETYAQRNDKELRVIYADLDRQIRKVLAGLQENVKNYRTF